MYVLNTRMYADRIERALTRYPHPHKAYNMLGARVSHTVLAIKGTQNSTRIALCVLHGDHATPYVTWRLDSAGVPYAGNYFKTSAEAWADFDKRSCQERTT